MRVIISVNILYCSYISRPPVENHWLDLPALSSRSIYRVPDLSDNVKKNRKTFVSHLFGSTVFADFYLNSVIFSPIILHQGVCRPCKLSYSFLLINVLRFIIVCSSFLTDF